jgi:hypothetical protein
MITATIDNKTFNREMNNLVQYSLGFVDGIQIGKTEFLAKLGAGIKEIFKEYIDSNARVSPETLHHVYEWQQTGSPEARLFDISYVVTGLGISFGYSFRQSTSIKNGSNVPFYDKARIMESGIPVTISPKSSKVLAFDIDGNAVFTSNSVRVNNPGGDSVKGGFENVFNSFFSRYLSQSFLQSSGMIKYLQYPVTFKKGLRSGKRSGRSAGVSAGYKWIVGAGDLV